MTSFCFRNHDLLRTIVNDDPYHSITARVVPPQPGVGNIAINDAFMLEGAIYFLLKKHFRGETYYVDLLELFHDVSWGRGSSEDVILWEEEG